MHGVNKYDSRDFESPREMEATLGATRGYAIVRIVSSTIGAKGSDLFRENFLNLLYRDIWRGCQEKNEKNRGSRGTTGNLKGLL